MKHSKKKLCADANARNPLPQNAGLRVCGMVFSEREGGCVRDFSELKDRLQVFHQFVILLMSEESEEAAACLSEG